MSENRWEGIDEFVAVAECSQFTAAAERLGVSSSHISRQIVRLEERLQTRLLYRSTRRVTLTEAGQTFLQHCQRLQDGREEALRAVGDLTSEPKGMLRMTCAVAYGERFIVPLVTRFMGLYPQLRVDIELSNRPLDLVHEGLDLAIRLGRLQDSRLVATRLAPRRMYLCASPSYLERYGRPHSLSELSRHNCLIGSSDIWQLEQNGREFSQRSAGKLALQQWASSTGCRATRRWVVSVAGLLRAGTSEKRRVDFAAGGPSTAEHGGLGALSAATASVAEGAQVGGLLEGGVGRAAGISGLISKDRSLRAAPTGISVQPRIDGCTRYL